ncbi:unnamed protein product [Ilex paraguariensis]|uniref:Pectinesterase inhibitor domain-containing protein n=1 Tax=Ilex paraguariensis TaxID=185542 RepID=A0ABC8V2P0_9AQUA
MAWSSISSSLLITLFFISPFGCRPNTTEAASGPLVTRVCRQAENPNFCFKSLGSDPRTETANLAGLAQIAIDLAIYNATGTSVKIHSLTLGTHDPRLRARYNKCAEYYQSAGDNFQEAKNALKSGDYSAVNVMATGSYDNAIDCENTFKQPPAYPSPLTNDNLNLRQLSYIVMIISKMLGM